MLRQILTNKYISLLSINSKKSSIININNTISSPITNTLKLTYQPIYHYHMSYLMDSKNDDKFVKIDRRAFHLYRDSILNFT